MRRTVKISVTDIVPDADAVLDQLAVPPGPDSRKKFESLLDETTHLLRSYSEPVGILSDVGNDEFSRIYEGEGRNEPSGPVQEIAAKADRLALFVLTLGQPVSDEMNKLLAEREFALAAMLDAAASEGAEAAADVIQREYLEFLKQEGVVRDSTRLLRYSPGYCGWHVSGQRALLDYLDPKEVGIKLSTSFLMYPLKSVSGVIVAGPAEIHRFEDSYPFCSDCQTRDCRERIRSLLEG